MPEKQYRLLSEDETILDGDEWTTKGIVNWEPIPAGFIGLTQGSLGMLHHFDFRRCIKQEATPVTGRSPESCATCRYSREHDGFRMSCQRFPPIVHARSVSPGWPRVGENDWCGEHRRMEVANG